MARFRRRKPTVVWLPTIPFANPEQQEVGPFISGSIIVPGNGGIVSDLIGLTFDFPPEMAPTADFTSLSDFEGSAYRLRRIVGKCFVSATQEAPAGGQPNSRPGGILVCAAFIVLRVNEETGNPLAASNDQYNPLNNDNIRDPWIWRRSWLLSNGLGAGADQPQYGEFPFSNVEYGSVWDGPHIDQKTARVISNEERLFFVLGASTLNSVHTENAHVHYVLDYRLLASMRKQQGNRRNASR